MYLLDANAFMEAKRLYYSFRIAPGFWQWLTTEFTARRIASISAVRDEIAAGDEMHCRQPFSAYEALGLRLT